MTIGAYREVAPPNVTPLPFGLLSVAQLVPDGDPHWRAGTWFQPDACHPAKSVDASCPNPALDFTKTPTTVGIVAKGADAFTVYSYIDCSPAGNFDEYDRRTRRALELGAPRAIEQVFWTGKVASPAVTGASIFPHLAANGQVFDATGRIRLQTAAIVVTGSGASGVANGITEAVGLLEEAMGNCYGGVPTIHIPRRGLSHLTSHFFVNTSGSFINMPSGTLVNAGGGNPNVGPDGSTPPAGQIWLYATGAVQYRRSEMEATSTLNEAIRRDVNSMRYVMEQTYQFNWDCCHFAVLVDVTGNN